jgi:hypothetical protein
MTYAAVAIAGSAIVGGGAIQAYYGNKASKRSAQAAAEAAEQMRQAKARAVSYQQPYYQSGNLGLANLTGLLTGQQYNTQTGRFNTLSPEERQGLFQTSPGYQFRLDQATKALQASQAARGGLLSGGAAKELTQYSQGIASDEYSNYINQLAGLAGIGQNAANAMGNYEIGAGNQIADYTQAQGLAQAQKYANMGSAFGGSLSQIGSLAGLAGSYGGSGVSSGGINPSSFQLQSPTYNINPMQR